MSAPLPPDLQVTLEDLAAVTPADLAHEITAATARVHACAQAWRNSASWRGDKLHAKAYDQVISSVAAVDSLPQPATYRDVDHLVDVVARIVNGWWPDTPGAQRDLHDAVEQLRRAAMYRTIWVRQARGMLGQPW